MFNTDINTGPTHLTRVPLKLRDDTLTDALVIADLSIYSRHGVVSKE
jgi:hypothetical protein